MSWPEFRPTPPSDAPVVLDRDLLGRLARLDLTPTALNAMLILLRHHDPDTGTVRLTVTEIAEELGMPRQNVSSALNNKLIPLGLVSAVRRGCYRLNAEFLQGREVMSLTPVTAPEPRAVRAHRQRKYAPQQANLRMVGSKPSD